MTTTESNKLDDHSASASASSFRFLDFDAIVMCLDDGDLLHPLTEGVPSALLPVANQPLVVFQLLHLQRAGCTSAIVVVSQSTSRAFTRCINSVSLQINIRIETVDDGIGTADALRRLKSLITKDFIVVNGDVLCDVSLVPLIDLHVMQSSSMTLLLSGPREKPTTTQASKGKSNKAKDTKALLGDIERLYVGLSSDQRLMYLRSAVDLESEDTFRLSKEHMKRCGSLLIRTRMRNPRVAVFAHWVLDLLEAKKGISSVHGELVPYLVEKQFGARPAFAHMIPEDDLALARSMSNSFAPTVEDVTDVHCFAIVVPPKSLCERISTIAAYTNANAEMLRLSRTKEFVCIQQNNHAQEVSRSCKKIKVGGSVIGPDVKAEEGSSIRSSVIGSGCSIGAGSSIVDCVLMNDVVIESGCHLEGTVVCAQVSIGAEATLDNCVVGPSYSVESGLDLKKETLFHSRE